jgi:hypothetical protein
LPFIAHHRMRNGQGGIRWCVRHGPIACITIAQAWLTRQAADILPTMMMLMLVMRMAGEEGANPPRVGIKTWSRRPPQSTPNMVFAFPNGWLAAPTSKRVDSQRASMPISHHLRSSHACPV